LKIPPFPALKTNWFFIKEVMRETWRRGGGGGGMSETTKIKEAELTEIY